MEESLSTIVEGMLHPSPVDKLDVKLILVLCVHLLAVGVMYGRITSDISTMKETLAGYNESFSALALSVSSLKTDLATIVGERRQEAATTQEIKERLLRLEQSTWKGDRRS